MNQGYLLGIDAGATKTAYALYDIQKQQCYTVTGGCGNHECLAGGYDELYDVMREHIVFLCTHAGIRIADIDAAGLGIAGTDTRRQHSLISDVFSRIGLKQFQLANDAMLGIKAESEDGTGICAINGTGFCVYGVDAQGHTSQLGGVGEISGDKGGGSYYAWRAVEAVYRYLEKEGPQTLMTERIFSLLKVREASGLIEAVSERLEGGGEAALIRELSVLLHESAVDGDAVARAILENSGAEYAACILSILRHLPDLLTKKKLTIVLAGSCFLRSACPLVRETIQKILQQKLPEIMMDIKAIQTEPVAGALLWAAEQTNCPRLLRDDILLSFSRAEHLKK